MDSQGHLYTEGDVQTSDIQGFVDPNDPSVTDFSFSVPIGFTANLTGPADYTFDLESHGDLLTVAPVPEPDSIVLLLTVFAAGSVFHAKKRRQLHCPAKDMLSPPTSR